LLSCGSVGIRSDAGGGGTGGATGQTDAGDDTPVTTDGGAGVTCAASKPLGTPLLVSGLNAPGTNSGARFSPDELTVYFANLRAADAGGTGNYQIFTATRSPRSAAFGTARAPTGINSATTSDYDPVITGDGLTLYFGSVRTAADRIYVSTFNPITANFSPPAVIDSISQAADAGATAAGTLDAFQPYVLPDNSVLYFGSTRAGSRDVYRSTRTTGAFGRPTAIAEINTTAVEQSPVVSPDELTIYWASTRTDGGAKAGGDIWMATRASVTDPFTGLRNVSEVNTALADAPSWVSPDGCRLYFSSGPSIYYAERQP
jgi:Tol biopolymer transport system component